MYFCNILMEIYLNIGQVDFLANVRMVKFGSELRYGIRSPNVRTPVDIPTEVLVAPLNMSENLGASLNKSEILVATLNMSENLGTSHP